VLGLDLPLGVALGVYPLATLIGAASLLPGGIGTTEVAMLVLLRSFGIGLDVAAVASLGMRLASTWLAIALGVVSLTILEFKRRERNGRSRRTPLRKPAQSGP
jgi:glycosyltransferase 2 family protein